jgi:hypothetical protein
MKRHYHLYSFIGNSLMALSLGGLALLGLLTNVMTAAWLFGWGLMFALVFAIGKVIDQEVDDMDKVTAHEIIGLVKEQGNDDCTCRTVDPAIDVTG